MGCNSSKQVQITEVNEMTKTEKAVRGDLYIAWLSPPSRATLMTCAALGIKPNLKPLDIPKGENKTPEFTALNPLQTVPTYVDGDFKLWESRAITPYLVATFGGSDNSLYPRDPQKRARVDNVLNADASTFYKSMGAFVGPQVFAGKSGSELEEQLTALKAAFKVLDENYLAKTKYVAGEDLTVADFSVLVTVTFTEVVDLDLSEFPNIEAWRKRMKALPYYEKCNKGLSEFKSRLQQKNST